LRIVAGAGGEGAIFESSLPLTASHSPALFLVDHVHVDESGSRIVFRHCGVPRLPAIARDDNLGASALKHRHAVLHACGGVRVRVTVMGGEGEEGEWRREGGRGAHLDGGTVDAIWVDTGIVFPPHVGPGLTAICGLLDGSVEAFVRVVGALLWTSQRIGMRG
jgi:hypothetical protein